MKSPKSCLLQFPWGVEVIWLFLAFFLSAFVSLILVRQASRWGFVDLPDDRKIHLVPTPRTGGLAVIIGGGLTLCLKVIFTNQWPRVPLQTLVAGVGFVGLGALDDRFNFRPRQKFLWFVVFSLLAAWPWVHPGDQYILILGDHVIQAPWWFVYPCVTIWFLAVPNAVNIEDAINGYMGGFAIILLLVATAQGVNLLIPVGALAGFLVFNWPKAKHFLGDAGSFGCGFLIAEVLLRSGGNRRPLWALMLTAPISLDVAVGIVRRIRLKKSLFSPDRETFPHRMMGLLGHSHAVVTPILLLNSVIIVYFSFHFSMVSLVYLIGFVAFLVVINRREIFRVKQSRHD